LVENVRYLIDCVDRDCFDPVALMECREHLSQTRTTLAQPEPEGVTDEELGAFFIEKGLVYGTEGTYALASVTRNVHGQALARAFREALARWGRPTIKPVPVAERPWEREGWCNSDNEAFFFDSDTEKWSLCECDKYSPVMTNASDRYTHSLPHNALPVPGAEVAPADRGSESSLAEFNDGGMPLG
jgi:hypothetical protein